MEQEIVRWVQYDNKIKEYNEKNKLLRKEKEKLSQSIFDQLNLEEKEKEDYPHYSIQELNTKISCHQTKTKEGFSNKFLLKCFQEYFKDEEEAKKLVAFIEQNRNVETKIVLKRDSMN